MGNLSPIATVTGTLSGKSELTGSISAIGSLIGKTSVPNDYVKYDGDYEVTPLANREVVLETKDKLLIDDILVKKIPRYDVSNESGGTTVYIAGGV